MENRTVPISIRKIKGLTQKYISKNLNVAENTISNYETEASNPNFDMIYNFLNVCDFDIQFIDKNTNKRYTLDELSKEMDF